MRKIAVLIIGLALTVTGAFQIGTVVAGQKAPPDPSAPWVTADGTFDPTALPECFVLLGRDGNPAKDTQGQDICIPSADIYGEPGVAKAGRERVILREKTDDGRERILVELQPYQP